MKKTVKIILIIAFIFILLNNTCIAVKGTPNYDIWGVGKNFIDTGVEQNGGGDITMDADAKVYFSQLIDFLWGLGLLTVFIATVIIGIKYMLVLPNERSRVKQATTPYVIGVIIIFGAVTIWKFLIDIFEGSL